MLSASLQQTFRQTIVAVVLFCLCLLPLQIAAFVHAADYNCGAYGRGAYDSGQVCGATSTDGGGDGGLANTGQALAVGIPALMILAGTILLFRTRKKRKHRTSEAHVNSLKD